jgi:hypothetical protein
VIQSAHVKCRGMGGCNGSSSDLVPLCGGCHRAQEGVSNERYQAQTGIDLVAEARRLEETWIART